MIKHTFALLTAAAALSMATTAMAQTLSITDLYNTGVNIAGTVLADNAIDPHYDISGAFTGDAIVATSAGGFPITPWIPEDANSAWATPANNTEGPAGEYLYLTTFTLPVDADLASVSITGKWATDDGGVSISLNGVLTNNTAAGGFQTYTPFSISGSSFTFVAGTNTLGFRLSNGGGPTGLRVDDMVGTYSVPEPAGLSLLALGGLGLLARRRRA